MKKKFVLPLFLPSIHNKTERFDTTDQILPPRKEGEARGKGAERPMREEAPKMPRYFLARVRNARAPSTAI